MSPASSSTALLRSVPDLPSHEVERLLVVATGRKRSELLIGVEVESGQADRFVALAERRRSGEPLQYLEGTVQFGPIEIAVDSRVLIPRPETEQLWELIVERCSSAPPRLIVDLCTGSGNLALALKEQYPEAEVFATDSSAEAVQVAKQNALDLGHEITVATGDLFEPLLARLRGSVDVIATNPPYLSVAEFDALPRGVRDHEPRAALVAGPIGDETLAQIATGAMSWLRPGGLIACEIADTQGGSARRLFSDYGVEILTDHSGRQRFAVGRRPQAR